MEQQARTPCSVNTLWAASSVSWSNRSKHVTVVVAQDRAQDSPLIALLGRRHE